MAKRGRPFHPDILTPREWEVLALLREGRSNEAIAAHLGVTVATARFHVSEILSKLGVATRREAAAWQPGPERSHLGLGAIVPVLRRQVRPTGMIAAGAAIVAVTIMVILLSWGILQTGTPSSSQTLPPSPAPDSGVPPPQLTLPSSAIASVTSASRDVAWAGGLSGVFRSADRGRSWTLAYASPQPVLAVDAAPDGTHGWASGGSGMVLRTDDGGATWQPQQSGVDVNLDQLAAVSADVAIVAGRTKGFSDTPPPPRPAILRTDDGGKSWRRMNVGKGVVAVDAISFLPDGRHGWVSTESCPGGKDGTLGGCVKERALYRTDDGGKSWVRVESGTGLMHLQFVDERAGWAISTNCGDSGCPSSLARTMDGGVTWEKVTVSGASIPGASPSVFNSFYAFSADTVDASDGACNERCSRIWRTTDGGATWSPLGEANATASADFVFSSGSDGIARGPLSWTDDGGATWHAAATPAAIGWGSMATADEQRAWFAGTKLLRTDDAGAHWSPVADRSLTSLSFVSAVEGWATQLVPAAGPSSVAVLHTTDGGVTWEQQYVTVSPNASGARALFISPLDGWLVMAADRRAVRTRDGGVTWEEQDLPTRSGQANVGSATFAATGTGWAAIDAVLYGTADGGAHWAKVHDFSGDSCTRVQDVAGFGAEVVRAVVVCRSALVLYGSDDGGRTWWSAQTPALYNLTLFDATNAAALSSACSGSRCAPSVVRTDDGGRTWRTENVNLPRDATPRAFFTPSRAWVTADTTIGSFGAATAERLYRYDLP